MEFDQRQGSSDGGAVLLKAAERRYGLISSMVDCLFDGRQASKVDHPLKDLFLQRVFSIVCGYPDANDSARLTADPLHKMLLDRETVVGLDLASPPTLSRFENSVGPKQLYRMGELLAESVISRCRKRLGGRTRRVTIDLDPTEHVYGEASYAAGTWNERRVVIKAEVVRAEGKRTQGQPALRHYQHETDAAVAL